MPRPGPRPYECVRRAWHSDRHLPIRGSLIQEIFRLVNEVHKIETKKNKEWQEKLPLVVLKAEEIMYSKANSEVEYVDLKTLGARVNDAINIIVRRDESSENDKLLQPCIEAALHLGCIPRRSSRSQRENNAIYYLNPGKKDDPSVRPCNTNQATHIPFMLQQPKFTRETNCSGKKEIFSPETFSQSGSLRCQTMKPCRSSNSYSVYPLYFGGQLHTKSSNLDFNIPTCPKSHLTEVASVEQNRASSKRPIVKSQEVVKSSRDIPYREGGCDLSLRLGPLTTPRISNESVWSNSSKERRKLSTSSPQMGSDFSFYPQGDDEESLDTSSTERSNESEMSSEDIVRKRKATFTPSFGDGKSGWQLKVPSN